MRLAGIGPAHPRLQTTTNRRGPNGTDPLRQWADPGAGVEPRGLHARGKDVYTQSRFMQGVYGFEGRGLRHSCLLAAELSFKLPFHKRGQLTYFRAGNSSDALIYLLLLGNGQPLRYFPVGAKASLHVQLAIVEDLAPETQLEVHVGAPEGVNGAVVIDIGWLEL